MNAQEAAAGVKKILVADDDQIILSTVSKVLKSKGYQVLTANEGPEIIKTVREERPNLILLDISFLPQDFLNGGIPWDGFSLLDWFRRMDETNRIPIIIISMSDPAKFKERLLAAGAVAYLQKPISKSDLLASVRNALGEDPA